MLSFLDNDLYKFTMQQAVCKLYPRARAQYQFINRGGTKFPEEFLREFSNAVQKMEELAITDDELKWLSEKCPFLDPVYLDFLKGYRYEPGNQLYIKLEDNDLKIQIAGPWHKTILWEVPLMALVSEIYFKTTRQDINPSRDSLKIAADKMRFFQSEGIKFADFGTRRRYSAKHHDDITEEFTKIDDFKTFLGTSNLHLAHKYDLRPIGTQAHEWIMFHAAKYGYRMANRIAMDKWVEIYRGDLGIALTDTFTTDNFFESFDMQLAKLFDGIRQDSGDPVIFLRKAIRHYKNIGIDPTTKSVVFSDGLNDLSAAQIHQEAKGRVRDVYGIGTNITNDVGVKPLNIVIKMTACAPTGLDWRNTIKLSDSPGKHTGDPEEIELCQRELFGIEKSTPSATGSPTT